MPIITCSSCGRKLKARDNQVGLKLRCPHCKTMLTAATEPPSAPARVSGNLRPCPDCGREASRRAAACPHCGCPFESAKPASSFQAVFAALVEAVRDLDCVITSLDKQNGMIEFEGPKGWFGFGQIIRLLVIDNGDRSCSVSWTAEYEGPILEKVFQRASDILKDQGLEGCLR